VTINIFSNGQLPLLHIRYMGCNFLPDTVNIGPMLRNSYIVHYVISGRGYYNQKPVETGQGFLMVPGRIEEYHADPADPWELVWVVSEDPAMEMLFQTFHADPETQIFSYDFVPAVRQTAEAMSLLPHRVVSCSELLALFLQLFQHQDPTDLPTCSNSRAQTYVDFSLDYIQKNYQNPISVQALADLLGISQPYLFRIFKQATGKSPKQYLNDYRLLQAKKLLSETSMTVTEIANSVGYSDIMTFSRFFSAKEACSPKAYRQTCK